MSEELLIISEFFLNLFEGMLPYLLVLWEGFKNFWWVFAPIILFFPLRFWYLLYIQTKWLKKIEWQVLEIKIPREVVRPLRAMENVFSILWGTYDAPNDKEKWIEGKVLLGFSLQIASLEGVPHFFIRINKALRKTFEAAFYSQFPDIEIIEAQDYTKTVPQDIPNKEWEMWGCNHMPLRSDAYPIKTYQKFFEEKPETPKEEKRIDPLASLLEGMTRLGKGEHLWIQILVTPITPAEDDYVKRGKEIVNKIVKRPEKPKPKPMIQEAAEILFTGKPSQAKSKEESFIPPEMKLTPGEREIVSAVEEKISKNAFRTCIRFIYLAKRDVFFSPTKSIPMTFFSQLSTQNLNGLKPWSKTITKVQAPNIFTQRRVYLKKRMLFKRYVARDTPFSPFPGGTFVLNTEELATIFHFPGIGVAPALGLERVEIKKGGPPAKLPM